MAGGSASEFGRFIEKIRQRLLLPLPGLEAHKRMLPSHRSGERIDVALKNGCRQAAVIVAIFPLVNEPAFVLTIRPGNLPLHAGQVSLPGGSREPGEDLVETALREAKEEVGIVAEEVEILGQLSPLYIPPTHYCVQPFVGSISFTPSFRPSEHEVAGILQIPVADLCSPGVRRTEVWNLDGLKRTIPFFELSGQKVWGATAMILQEFLQVVEDFQES